MKNQVRAMNEKDFVEAQKENVFQDGVVKLEKESIKMNNNILTFNGREDLDSAINEKFPYDEICCDIKYMFLELIGDSEDE